MVPLLPDATAEFYWVMAAVGFASVVYGALIAVVQTNLRRLTAFASVSHKGVITLGIFSLNVAGIEGALLQSLNLGITGAGRFLIATFVSTRVGSADLANMGGILSRAPLMALGFLVIALAAVGMPGTSGFPGVFTLLLWVFSHGTAVGTLALLGVILGAGYVLWFYERAFFGPAKSADIAQLRDLGKQERMGAAAAIALVFVIGLLSMVAVPTVTATTDQMLSTLETRTSVVMTADLSESN